MSENRINFKNISRRLRHRTVEFNLEPYERLLGQVNNISFSNLKDPELKNISCQLIQQARRGVPERELLVTAYALVREAAWRVLGLRPFDVQVTAGIVMHYGGLAEMQTGEGKTLTAVFPAYLNALSGRGVHVLTFNDYLARRDAMWMGPVYEFLGMAVGYINEGMTVAQRRKAYSCDITYLTAKEAGFDYLKGFLCLKKEELVHRPFHFAIIDEADSILIDEARIPLVIAGETGMEAVKPAAMPELIRCLKPGIDYETEENERSVYLTECGIANVEGILNCGNLYDSKNLNLLVDVNNALHAEVLLKRDVDYIVKNGRIELVDEFTGRVADRRHWPYGLQEAIEAKEGIKPEQKGQILTSITMQNFIRLYPGVCGMTGTAVTSAEEFLQTYGLRVVVIPTNKPCIRQDYPDMIFANKEAKLKALISEIINVHNTGRPILIGTCSVEESEQLAERLRESGACCNVLNAKNDELEAGIIAQAGAIGAVTVSTNMAGRGTDIKLGGEKEEEREEVVALGGLYVIGTGRNESRRIDDQLRGRAGRQGDPGSTRFFISLEDTLMKRYRIKELIPESIIQKSKNNVMDHPLVARQIAHAQRVIEGQNFEIRKTLSKYTVIIERQRQMVHSWRYEILTDRGIPGLMAGRLPERYDKLRKMVGEEGLIKAEKQVSLHFINKCWAEYMDYMSYVRESIHLVNIAGKIPVSEFNKIAIEAFEKLHEDIAGEIVNVLASAEISSDGIDMEKEGLNAPTSTWTYLINDSPEQLGINPVCQNFVAAAVSMPIWVAAAVFFRFFRKTERLK